MPLGDQIAKDLVDYTEAETLNPSMVRSLSEFASNLSTVQDYRQAQVGGLAVTRYRSAVLKVHVLIHSKPSDMVKY